MTADVEVQNSAAPMLNNEETIQQLECHCWDGEKVQGDDHFAMVSKERQPVLRQYSIRL
jgi:hypothetical protein